MSETVDRCEGRVYPTGFRAAGGFQCANPAKYTVEDKRHSRTQRVCGVHRRVELRYGWEDATP